MLQIRGKIFETVQTSGIFPDSKTFSDAIPKRKEENILHDFEENYQKPDFDLKTFVEENFEILKPVGSSTDRIDNSSMEAYIESLWDVLKRDADQEIEGDSLIPLPYPYIVPGGRFREIYYWDSYFTAEGLATVERYDIIESMLKNFVYLQKKIGLIPNGNRWYFATRSQPPVLGLMINVLYEKFGLDHIKPYLSALEREHAIWTTGNKKVTLPDGSVLSRYWDKGDYPREEAYKEDKALAVGMTEEEAKELYRNLRTGAESGCDFTARWLRDPKRLETIETTKIIPVDLNALVYGFEVLLAQYHDELGNPEKAKHYHHLAEARKIALNKYCWNDEVGYYFDYNTAINKQSTIYAVAGAVPIFVKMVTQEQADRIAPVLIDKLLEKGGFRTSLVDTDLQWDGPNGWPPMQWFAVKGLLNYGKTDLAIDAMQRWVKTMRNHFAKEKMLMEKYNVVNLDVLASGGEYSVQEGFSWTNGIALKFLQLLKELK